MARNLCGPHHHGRRDFIFYGPSRTGFAAAVSNAMAPFNFEFDTLEQADPGWTFYFDALYPNQWHRQAIMNRDVLENLRRGGDDLSKPRRIFHWLYFSTASDRDNCAEAARRKGFGTQILPTTKKADARYPLGLQVHRIDAVVPPAINDLCFELFTLAQQSYGEYDGWETQIVKPGREPIDDAPDR